MNGTNGILALFIWLYQVMGSTIVSLMNADTWIQRSAWTITIILGIINLYIVWPKLVERCRETFTRKKKKRSVTAP